MRLELTDALVDVLIDAPDELLPLRAAVLREHGEQTGHVPTPRSRLVWLPLPAHLDRVTISLWHGPFELPWSSRNELLEEMARVDDSGEAIRAFHGAGASSPVRLDRADKEMLVRVIETWFDEVGKRDLPHGIWELRAALLKEQVWLAREGIG